MEYLADRLSEPGDYFKVYPWDKLSKKSQKTLHRAIARSDAWTSSELSGFSFDLLKKISIRDLNDARFIGPARAEELIQELKSLFEDHDFRENLDATKNAAANVISVVPPEIVTKLIVEEDLYKYYVRMCSVKKMSRKRRNSILQELFPTKNSVQGVMFESRDQKNSLGHLIEANLLPSFSIAKSLCKDQDLRARAIAGNIGMLEKIEISRVRMTCSLPSDGLD